MVGTTNIVVPTGGEIMLALTGTNGTVMSIKFACQAGHLAAFPNVIVITKQLAQSPVALWADQSLQPTESR